MTIGALISELEKARQAHGDVSVNYDDGDGTVEIERVHWRLGCLVVDKE